MKQLPETPSLVWLAAMVVSAVAHVAAVGGFAPKKPVAQPVYERIQVKLTPPAAEVMPKTPIPKKQKTPKTTPNDVIKAATPDAPPVQGLTRDSTAVSGTMAAPVGNTMMVEDKGQRLNPSDVKPLAGDLSAPAILQRNSIQTPPYTDQALDASLEGTWIVDVYVELSGAVVSAELRKKIGYGMDERVLAAAKAAKFTPRKNKFGASEAGWAEIKFTLVIP